MNRDIMRIKKELKKELEKWQWDYYIATGIKPALLVSDFGSRLEVQLPETVEKDGRVAEEEE